jgi:hypothetical protein
VQSENTENLAEITFNGKSFEEALPTEVAELFEYLIDFFSAFSVVKFYGYIYSPRRRRNVVKHTAARLA